MRYGSDDQEHQGDVEQQRARSQRFVRLWLQPRRGLEGVYRAAQQGNPAELTRQQLVTAIVALEERAGLLDKV